MAHNEYENKMMRDSGYSEMDAVLKSMKRSKKKAKKESKVSVEPMSYDEYPYGLQLELNDETLKMLDVDLKSVGDYCMIEAVGKITSVSERSDTDGKNKSMSVQITKMNMSPYKMMDDKDSKDSKDA